MKRIAACMLGALLLAVATAHAASPSEQIAHEQEVFDKCNAASGLSDPHPGGGIVPFGDDVGYDAVLVQGRVPQPHMKSEPGQVLCLFNRRTRAAHVSDAEFLVHGRRKKQHGTAP